MKVRISYQYYRRAICRCSLLHVSLVIRRSLRPHPHPSAAVDRRIQVEDSGTVDAWFPTPGLTAMLYPVESKPGANEITGSLVASAELVEKGVLIACTKAVCVEKDWIRLVHSCFELDFVGI